MFDLSLDDKLYRTKFEPDRDRSHIQITEEVCRKCRNKVCTRICPAEVYTISLDDPEMITVRHENCLECGTCRKACPEEGIEWRYPRGGMGVKYRFG